MHSDYFVLVTLKIYFYNSLVDLPFNLKTCIVSNLVLAVGLSFFRKFNVLGKCTLGPLWISVGTSTQCLCTARTWTNKMLDRIKNCMYHDMWSAQC